jgi:hypothetical protein
VDLWECSSVYTVPLATALSDFRVSGLFTNARNCEHAIPGDLSHLAVGQAYLWLVGWPGSPKPRFRLAAGMPRRIDRVLDGITKRLGLRLPCRVGST